MAEGSPLCLPSWSDVGAVPRPLEYTAPYCLSCTVTHRRRGKAGARCQKHLQPVDSTDCVQFVLVIRGSGRAVSEVKRDRTKRYSFKPLSHTFECAVDCFMIFQIFNIHFCLSAFRSDVSGEITKTSKSEQIFVMFFLLRAEWGRVYTDAKTAAELLNRKRFLTLSRLPTCTTQCVCVCVCVVGYIIQWAHISQAVISGAASCG